MANFQSGLCKLFQKFIDSGASFENCSFSDSEDEAEPQAHGRGAQRTHGSQIRRQCRPKNMVLTFRQLFGAPLLVRRGLHGPFIVDTMRRMKKTGSTVSVEAYTQTPPHPHLSYSGRLSINASADPVPLPITNSRLSEPECLLLHSAASVHVSVSCQVSAKPHRSRSRNRRRGGTNRQKIKNVFSNVFVTLIATVQQNMALKD